MYRPLNRVVIFSALLFILGVSVRAEAANLERLFDQVWSAKCAEQVQVETSEFTSFKQGEWCESFVDDYRVQSNCQDTQFAPLAGNRISAELASGEKYIFEFLWSTHISIMRVENEKPLKLKQASSLGMAIWRKGLETHHPFCP